MRVSNCEYARERGVSLCRYWPGLEVGALDLGVSHGLVGVRFARPVCSPMLMRGGREGEGGGEGEKGRRESENSCRARAHLIWAESMHGVQSQLSSQLSMVSQNSG